MHYDFAISSGQPLDNDENEVGAHTRRLLHALSSAGLRCVAFVAHPPSPTTIASLPSLVEFVVVRTGLEPMAANMGDTTLNFTRDLCVRLCDFLREHTIRVLEFPDIRAEGYFFLQHNLVHHQVPTTVVRLHGPTFLIDEANGRRLCTKQDALLYAAELESIQFADHVAHSGPALLDRVLACFSPATARDIRARTVFAPLPADDADAPTRAHDAPPTIPARCVVCPGALEYRAGTDLFVRNAVRHLLDCPDSPWSFVCVGRDSDTAGGGSFLAYLQAMIPPGSRSRFSFETELSTQARKARFAEADAFILPRRDPGHPQALAEILPHGRPCAVSSFIDTTGEALPGVVVFSPESDRDWTGLWTTLRTQASSGAPKTVADRPASGIARIYQGLRDTRPDNESPATAARLAIVIPHHEDVDNLESLLGRLRGSPCHRRLEIVVVDDGSSPSSQKRLEALTTKHPEVRWLRTSRPRSGPFAARLLGTAAVASEHVAFVDSDDHIDPELYLTYAQSLARTPELDVVLPSMRCFGLETRRWIPLPKARFTAFFTGFAHVGLVGKRERLLRAFEHARPTAMGATHGEDCIFSLSLLFTGARIAGLLEIAYHYNRTVTTSRSQTNAGEVWRSRHLRDQHFDRCMSEALAEGALTALDLRVLRLLALSLPAEHSAINLRCRHNHVPWHTHLYRAVRSLLGDPRYRA